MDLVPVVSSNLAEVGYDAGTQTLEVAFKNGSIYQYEGVSAQLHADLMAAGSLGKFLDRHIKKAGYGYRRID